ncbi:MAG TPA: helix-turn-helix transcriptional regulator [Micromonosporaceae bacterium]|nr:helix-turn-helix transcriptional regulator [Micromonosporaceae bacterium]
MRGLERVTQPTLDVLEALLSAEGLELHGWAITKATQRTGPTVYKILERLTVGGLVTARWESEHPEPGKPRRRFYRLTPTGAERARGLLAQHRPGSARGMRPAFGAGG